MVIPSFCQADQWVPWTWARCCTSLAASSFLVRSNTVWNMIEDKAFYKSMMGVLTEALCSGKAKSITRISIYSSKDKAQCWSLLLAVWHSAAAVAKLALVMGVCVVEPMHNSALWPICSWTHWAMTGMAGEERLIGHPIYLIIELFLSWSYPLMSIYMRHSIFMSFAHLKRSLYTLLPQMSFSAVFLLLFQSPWPSSQSIGYSP